MEEIIKIVNETPNDMELGKKIREWYFKIDKKFINPYKVNEIVEDWYKRNEV
jgi:hypothetical protein